MSDFDQSLPVKTENDGDVVSKIADANTPSQQLKVNADGTIDVNADITNTDLDIRDLDSAQDNVAISDGVDTLEINSDGSLNAVVTATNLDVRDLTFSTDKVDVSGSTGLVATVSATNLDIRDIDYLTDDITSYDPTLTSRVDEVSKTLTYIGKAAIASAEGSAVWQIQRLTVTGAVTSTLWADGNANYDNIWTNRAALTYS